MELNQKTKRKSEKKMQLRKIIIISMKETLARIRSTPLYRHPSAFMWQQCLSINNQFCDAVVRAGYLSYEQMFSAACRYCIGASKLGGVIFWQIDHEGRIHDGKIMYSPTVTAVRTGSPPGCPICSGSVVRHPCQEP